MNQERSHSNFPKLHTTVGINRKNSGTPPIDLESFLDLTTRAEHDGARFDGIDLALHESHLPLTATDSQLKEFTSEVLSRGLVVGTVAMPVWTGPMDRPRWLDCIRASCRIGRRLRSLGGRPYGAIRIEAACDPVLWNEDPFRAQRGLVDDFRAACGVADEFGERLAIGGAFLEGHLQDWRSMLDLLVRVNRTGTLGLHVDLTGVFRDLLRPSATGCTLLPANWDSSDVRALDVALKTLSGFLRPWAIDLNISQTDGPPVFAHVLPGDPDGRLQLTHHAGAWLHGAGGNLTRGLHHLSWDAGPFPGAVLMKQETWDNALVMMLAIRNAHGWKGTKGRKRVDPAESILLARQATRRNGQATWVDPARRQSTLRVGGGKGQAVARKRKSSARMVKRRPRARP